MTSRNWKNPNAKQSKLADITLTMHTQNVSQSDLWCNHVLSCNSLDRFTADKTSCLEFVSVLFEFASNAQVHPNPLCFRLHITNKMDHSPCHGRSAQTGYGQVHPYPLCFRVQVMDRVGALKQLLFRIMVRSHEFQNHQHSNAFHRLKINRLLLMANKKSKKKTTIVAPQNSCWQ